MKPGLQLRAAPTLTLSPQLQQAIRLLQLSSLELQQKLQQMLAENPFLEQVEDSASLSQTGEDPGQETTFAAKTDTENNASAPDTFSVLSDEPGSFAAVHEHDDNWREEADASVLDNGEQSGLPEGTPAHALEEMWGGEGSTTSTDATETANAGCQHVTLHDHLRQQTLALRLDEAGRAALDWLIGSLNADGYLEDSLAELAQSFIVRQDMTAEDAQETMSELLHQLTVALRLLRTLDPPGMGARDLGECLRLQLGALPIANDQAHVQLTRETAMALCHQPLEYLARRDVRQLQKLTGFPISRIKAAMQLIATLDPKPGRRFTTTGHHIIIPDVLVTANRDAHAAGRPWLVEINPAVLPRVRVHRFYASALRQHPAETTGLLNQRLQEARWMVRSLQQRFDTILRVAQAIVVRQQRFFSEGPQAMQPLLLREIAAELDLHESTISRVTNGKYMASPRGTFELKYFFGSALETKDGEVTSGTAIRALLQQLIAQESSARPLSDTRLCELLQEQGIQCARRTVAKYRETLCIPPAHLRRCRQER